MTLPLALHRQPVGRRPVAETLHDLKLLDGRIRHYLDGHRPRHLAPVADTEFTAPPAKSPDTPADAAHTPPAPPGDDDPPARPSPASAAGSSFGALLSGAGSITGAELTAVRAAGKFRFVQDPAASGGPP